MTNLHSSFQEGMSQVGQVVFISTCAAPTGATTSLSGDTSGVVSWSGPTGANISYNIDYKISTNSTWIPAGSTPSLTFTVTNLAGATDYDFRVQKVCGVDVYSPYANAGSISTNYPACDAVTNLSTTPSSFSAVSTWTAASAASSYNVYLDNIFVINVSTTNYTFTGLNDNTTYNVKIETLCPGSTTPPSISNNFTTVVFVCAQVTNYTLTGTSNSITGSWTAVSGALNYGYSINNGPYIVTNLTTFTVVASQGTIYNANVVTYCVNNHNSSPILRSFTTPITCLEVSNLVATVTYPSGQPSLGLSWTPVGTSISYSIYIDSILVNTITGAASSWDSSSHGILIAPDTHTVRVVTNCSASSTLGITTPFTVDGCDPVNNLTITGVLS